MPIEAYRLRWYTCGLRFFSWMLDHVIYLKLRKKYCCYTIELLNNKSHGLLPPGGFSFLSVVRCRYLCCSTPQYIIYTSNLVYGKIWGKHKMWHFIQRFSPWGYLSDFRRQPKIRKSRNLYILGKRSFTDYAERFWLFLTTYPLESTFSTV